MSRTHCRCWPPPCVRLDPHHQHCLHVGGGGSCQQVVAAAAARLQQERVARAAQDAATLSMQTARVAAQNKQAQVHMHRKRAQKQQLPVRLRAVARGLSLLVCQQ